MNIRRGCVRAVLLASVALFAGRAGAETVLVDVDSHSGPWNYAAGGLNDAYQYGVQDFIGPSVVGAAQGFDFTPGGTLTIAYVSGLTSPFGGIPYADSVGDTGYVADDGVGSSGQVFPSFYVDPSEYPAYLNALVGVFADASGQLVGPAFLVGLMRDVIIPVGAVQLQLGFNDDIFNDNTGSILVSVTGPGAAVPEPSSLALSASAAALGLGLARRKALRRRNAA